MAQQQERIDRMLEAELTVVPPKKIRFLHQLADEQVKEQLASKKKTRRDTDLLALSDAGANLYASIESWERALRKRFPPEFSGSSSLPEIHFRPILIDLAPHIRCIYEKMEPQCRFYFQSCMMYNNSELKSKAEDLLVKMRQLLVDPDLIVLEKTPIASFLEGIRSIPPHLDLESQNQPQCCRKCGRDMDIIFSPCRHTLCVICIGILFKENWVKCHVCEKQLLSQDLWIHKSIPSSKYDAILQLLSEHSGKCIIFCEFGEALVNLQSALTSCNIRAKICREKTGEMAKKIRIEKFCQKEKVRVLLATFGQLDYLASFSFACASSIYLISPVPKNIEERAISLIHSPGKNIQVYKLISKRTIEAMIFESDVGRIDEEANLAFSTEEVQWLFQI